MIPNPLVFCWAWGPPPDPREKKNAKQNPRKKTRETKPRNKKHANKKKREQKKREKTPRENDISHLFISQDIGPCATHRIAIGRP